MEIARFIFWTALKTLSLAFLGLLAVKAASEAARVSADRRLAGLRAAVAATVLALVAVGGWFLGYDVAAEIYYRTAQSSLARGEVARAYSNSRRAVEIRPANLAYWQVHLAAKFAARQFESLLEDRPALETLNGGRLAPADAYRIAAAHYFLAQYDRVYPLTGELIRENPMFAAPYVLQGYALTSQRKFGEAEKTFLEILQILPTQQSAVEGLAHVHFLRGNVPGALHVLEETRKFPFPPEARSRFEELKALYAQ